MGKRYEIEKQLRRNNNRPIWEPIRKPDGTEPSAQELYDAGGHLIDYKARMKNPTAERIGEEYHISHGDLRCALRDEGRKVSHDTGCTRFIHPQSTSGGLP